MTGVRKPVLAVRRLVERGNVVRLGPEPEQNYIVDIQSGKRIMMEKKGASFAIKEDFLKKLGEYEGFARQDSREMQTVEP